MELPAPRLWSPPMRFPGEGMGLLVLPGVLVGGSCARAPGVVRDPAPQALRSPWSRSEALPGAAQACAGREG